MHASEATGPPNGFSKVPKKGVLVTEGPTAVHFRKEPKTYKVRIAITGLWQPTDLVYSEPQARDFEDTNSSRTRNRKLAPHRPHRPRVRPRPPDSSDPPPSSAANRPRLAPSRGGTSAPARACARAGARGEWTPHGPIWARGQNQSLTRKWTMASCSIGTNMANRLTTIILEVG